MISTGFSSHDPLRMKILVTGNAGAGKSTLAVSLGQALNLQTFSLDSIVWQERWRKTPTKVRDARIAELIANDSWVIDGVSSAALHAADVVVFLDVPRWKCLLRAMKRNSRYLFSSRPELPNHCPEILIVPTLLRIIWRFDSRVRPMILLEKQRRVDQPGSFVHVGSHFDFDVVHASLVAGNGS